MFVTGRNQSDKIMSDKSDEIFWKYYKRILIKIKRVKVETIVTNSDVFFFKIIRNFGK